ncbi:hemolysin secretion protein D [Vulcanimicrobium alpinum]|uniref:Hemolysin secretion protein D n=1 Tax=Vulcanimicrobium alpinum TaxID=3016050 RepID=A0AAN1XVC8_UNVUL|nr:HlyD family secretion protein [Vulcanimicrobium alpinum]BDE06106.1 hemolysin secretion protein D [Vulcanimicrobium alpinum]
METRTEAPPQPRPTVADGRGAPPSAPAGGAAVEATSRRRPPIAVIVVGAIVLVAALIWGVRYLAYATTHESTDDARVDADTVTVTSKIAERVNRILVDTNQPVRKGQVIARMDDTDERNAVQQAQAALDAQRSQARAAQENVSLTRAQVAAQSQQGSGGITSARSSIVNAQANAASAQQQADAARAAIAQSQAQLKVAQSQVPAARQGLVRANADLARYAALVRTGDVASQQLDAQRAAQAQAQSQYQSALDNVTAAQTAVVQSQARYTAAVAAANAATAGIGAQQGQLQTAQGRLTESDNPYRVSATQAQADAAFAQAGSLQAQLKTAQDKLAYTQIRAPIDGIVGAKNVEVGTYVSPGQSLIVIVPNSGTYVTANFKETQLGKIKVGQPVDVTVDAYKGTTFHGHVSAIAPASQNTFSLVPAQNATGNFVKVTQRIPVRIIVDNPPADKPLRVGMSVVAAVDTRKGS